MIHYPNIIRSHLIPIVPMLPFTSKSASKLRYALDIRSFLASFPIANIIYFENRKLNPNNH